MNRALLGGLHRASSWCWRLPSPATSSGDRITAGTPVPSAARAVAGPALAEALQAGFVDVAQQVRPAVVQSRDLQKSKAGRPTAPAGSDDPFLRDFFNQFFGTDAPGRRSEFRRPGLGSGVIIDKRGLVLTNFHVSRAPTRSGPAVGQGEYGTRSWAPIPRPTSPSSGSTPSGRSRWPRSATRKSCASASGPSPSATRSGSTRPSRWASSAPPDAPTWASRPTRTSSRPTPRSTRATPAARSVNLRAR